MDFMDYVLATKYSDGDPKDHWCVGFFDSMTDHIPPRYNVVDAEGKQFRHNGFRCIKNITREEGAALLKSATEIEQSGESVWDWLQGHKYRVDVTFTVSAS
jgi:hypothetical protein